MVVYPYACLRANDYKQFDHNLQVVECDRELSCITLRPSILRHAKKLQLFDNIDISDTGLERALKIFRAKDQERFEEEFLSQTASQTDFRPFLDRGFPQLATVPEGQLVLVLVPQPPSSNLPYAPMPKVTKSSSFSTAAVNRLLRVTSVDNVPDFVKSFIESMEKPRAISQEVCNPPPFTLLYCSQLEISEPRFNQKAIISTVTRSARAMLARFLEL